MANGHFKQCTVEDNCWCEIKRYWIIFGISITVFVLEIFGGIASQSLALLADAGHVLTDTGATLVTIIVTYRVRSHPESTNTTRKIGGYINVILLGVIAFWIGIEAIKRILTPYDNIALEIMTPFAIFGIMGNFLQYALLRSAKETHITHELMMHHVLYDLKISVGVIFGGSLIWITGWITIDPIISIIISIMIFRTVYTIFLKLRHGEYDPKHCSHS